MLVPKQTTKKIGKNLTADTHQKYVFFMSAILLQLIPKSYTEDFRELLLQLREELIKKSYFFCIV